MKIDWGDNRIGFAEYSPWIHLGQKPIDHVLEEKGQVFKHLVKRCYRDVYSYSELIDQNLPGFKNNSFIAKSDGIYLSPLVVKIKLAGQIEKDLERVLAFAEKFETLRFDANCTYNKDTFLEFFNRIPSEVRKKIEYFEDPIRWDSDDFSELEREHIPIRLDQAYNQYELTKPDLPFISKPSLRLDLRRGFSHDVIFSSNMMGMLSSWQDYCDLISNGNLNLTHGIYSPSVFEGEDSIFELGHEEVNINKNGVKNNYLELKEMPWTSLSP